MDLFANHTMSNTYAVDLVYSFEFHNWDMGKALVTYGSPSLRPHEDI